MLTISTHPFGRALGVLTEPPPRPSIGPSWRSILTSVERPNAVDRLPDADGIGKATATTAVRPFRRPVTELHSIVVGRPGNEPRLGDRVVREYCCGGVKMAGSENDHRQCRIGHEAPCSPSRGVLGRANSTCDVDQDEPTEWTIHHHPTRTLSQLSRWPS